MSAALHRVVGECSLSRRVRRDGLVVRGPDAAEWLQGQVTQDVKDLPIGTSVLTLVLSPQGKIDSFCRVTREGDDEFLLDTESGFGPSLSERLRRFKLRVKVELEEVSLECSERLGGGFDSLGRPEPAGDEASPDTLGEEFERERIRAAVPRLGRELTEQTIPQEAGEELLARTVSFTKGCYTGQELVARLDARGSNVARRLRVVEGSLAPSEPDPEPGESLLDENDKEAGTLTSSVRSSPESFVALCYLRRAYLHDAADLRLRGRSVTVAAPRSKGEASEGDRE